MPETALPALPKVSAADRLNKACLCVTLDRGVLCDALEREADAPGFCTTFVRPREHLFSNVPVFLPLATLERMQRIVAAIETASRLPGYRDLVLSWAPPIAQADPGPIGAFMGYDFHLDGNGPRLIEVNTNAGGAFLNALLARAQRACCAEMEGRPVQGEAVDFTAAVLRMFRDEWSRQFGSGNPERIAIVDDQPEEQYLYPEFVLARKMLSKAGTDAVIADPGDLRYEGGRLMAGDRPIDLVYNRLVDFALERLEHQALRMAYEAGAVAVTPNPHNHALLADKRNLTLLSDPARLKSWGLSAELAAALASVPRTTMVTPENADALWASRKQYFFKPYGGHGGKGAYRGDKLTRAVWVEIAAGGYVAQAFAAPGERLIEVDGQPLMRKMDVRLYTYAGRLLLAAARIYQGQTTNFRTPGGGFAPVFALE
jgi:hypothetical protein